MHTFVPVTQSKRLGKFSPLPFWGIGPTPSLAMPMTGVHSINENAAPRVACN